MIETFPFPVELEAFVIWLAGPAAVGVILSYLLERLPFWNGLSSRVKQLSVLGLSLLLPVLSAWILGNVNVETIKQVDVLLSVGLQGLVVWQTSQWAHADNPYRTE